MRWLLPTLGLDGVEEGELVAVEALKGWAPEGGDRKWLEVQELGGWGVLLREDQVTERDRKLGLST